MADIKIKRSSSGSVWVGIALTFITGAVMLFVFMKVWND